MSLELGQPLHHQRGPRQRSCGACTCGRRHLRRTRPVDGRWSTDDAGSGTALCAACELAHEPEAGAGPARGSPVLSRVPGSVVYLLLFSGCQFHLLVCAKPIAAGSVCADSEAVVAATRRIRAAFRRGARISINSCAHGCSTTKAIKAAPPLSGRTGDGASRRDSRKSLPVVRYRNASWL